MRPTHVNGGASAQDWLREEISRALKGPHRPFADYLTAYRKKFDELRRLRPCGLPPDLAELAKKSAVARMGLVDSGFPVSHPFPQIGKQWSFLSEYAKRLKPKEIQEQGKEIRRGISTLSRSVGCVVPRYTGMHLGLASNADVASYFDRAQKASEALTPKPGATSISTQMAKAAITKLVDFVEGLGNMTEMVITAKVTMNTGVTTEVEQRVKADAAVPLQPCAEPMEPTRATCNGNPVTIMVPKALNRGLNSGPIEIGQPQRQVSAADEVPIGKYAKKHVKSANRKSRQIVFTGRSHAKVVVPPDSDGVWNYMERLIASDDPQGWVELGEGLSPKWSGYFTRIDAHGLVDAKHPLTNLLCRIESCRRRGRPRRDGQSVAKGVSIPRIRLVAFDKDKFKAYAMAQAQVN